MADNLPGTPTTEWQRQTPGAAASQGILDQVIAQAAAAAAAAAQAAQDASDATDQATAAATSAGNAESAAVAAAASASSANTSAAAAAASAAAAAAAAGELGGAVAGQIRVSKDGGPASVVQNVDVGAGLFLNVVGDTAYVRTAVERGDVQIAPGAMTGGQVVTGTIALGALSALRRIVASHKVWLRLYETAADRTADAARAMDADPTTPIILDMILVSSLDELVRDVMAYNGDNPAVNDIYYSLKLLEVTGGASQSASDSVAAGGPTVLSSTTPTGSPQDFDYEYTGTAADFEVDIYGQITAANGTVTPRPLRTSIDLVDDVFEMWVDLYRFSVDQNSDFGGLIFNVPNTAIGSYDNRVFYSLLASRASNSTAHIRLQYTDSEGDTSVIEEELDVSFATSTGIRLRIEVNDLDVTVYMSEFDTGASEVELFTATLPVDLRDGNHKRAGVMTYRQLASSGIHVAAWAFTATAPSTVVPTVDVTRTRLEEAA